MSYIFQIYETLLSIKIMKILIDSDESRIVFNYNAVKEISFMKHF